MQSLVGGEADPLLRPGAARLLPRPLVWLVQPDWSPCSGVAGGLMVPQASRKNPSVVSRLASPAHPPTSLRGTARPPSRSAEPERRVNGSSSIAFEDAVRVDSPSAISAVPSASSAADAGIVSSAQVGAEERGSGLSCKFATGDTRPEPAGSGSSGSGPGQRPPPGGAIQALGDDGRSNSASSVRCENICARGDDQFGASAGAVSVSSSLSPEPSTAPLEPPSLRSLDRLLIAHKSPAQLSSMVARQLRPPSSAGCARTPCVLVPTGAAGARGSDFETQSKWPAGSLAPARLADPCPPHCGRKERRFSDRPRDEGSCAVRSYRSSSLAHGRASCVRQASDQVGRIARVDRPRGSDVRPADVPGLPRDRRGPARASTVRPHLLQALHRRGGAGPGYLALSNVPAIESGRPSEAEFCPATTARRRCNQHLCRHQQPFHCQRGRPARRRRGRAPWRAGLMQAIETRNTR